ncbi:MAG: site-specific integrase, partial [Elusimicrobiota bacterium]
MNLFIEKFLLHLKSQLNFSRHTIKAYKFDLTQFSEFASRYNISSPEKIDRLILRNYIAHIQERKVLRNTLLRKISSVRSFIN